MLEGILRYVKNLFNKSNTITTTKQQEENQAYADKYMDISKINYTALFANKLATKALAESTISVLADNKRAELLNSALLDLFEKMKKITVLALSVGGCLIVPYVREGRILFNIVKQNRLIINEKIGNKITDATVIAESTVINNSAYYRIVNYEVINGALKITNMTVSEYGAPAIVEAWEDVQDVVIANVDRVLFGFIKSPIDNRESNDMYGVPITYGCQKIIDDIEECFEQIKTEFKLKKVRLQVDDRVLTRDPQTGKPVLKDELFMGGHSEDGNMFNVFDPAIRESSYYRRLTELFELFEKAVGTSKGILTTPESQGATATEIKAAVGDTFDMISDIRKEICKGIDDYTYACDVLANYYNLTPPGEYEIKYDWSYSMIESSTETFTQMKELQAMGAMSKAQVRAWMTGESLDEAEKQVEEIKAKEPSARQLLGID